ncbi:MAG TPA: ABC transporter ATP-binding protein [Flavobacteriaceae bacterium]|nr:ABC transporter ATP-binding protein [Flavobacteriaceae bacterium]
MEKPANNPILKAENLAVGYRGKREEIVVSSGMNFSIHEGELVAVVGINGAGKSTLLKTLTKELSPLEGSIFINGVSLEEYSNKNLAELISVVLTNQTISKNLSVYELVALGRQPYTDWLGNLNETDKKAILRAMEQVELRDLSQKKCSELSDGQLQKVLIARTLAQDTPLIFMDEPTTHLDLYHKAHVLQLLKKLSQETKKAIVFASHEINLALRLCDTIILLHGSHALFGSPESLIQNGGFDSLFPAEIIEFDRISRSFQIRG